MLVIDPLFTKIRVKPDDGGISEFCNKSLVVLLYTSKFPETKPFNIEKSKPKLTCSVVSQVKSGFARFRNAIGTLVPPVAFPYKLFKTP